MTTNLVIDIETVALPNAPEYFNKKEYEAPSNYKSVDSIMRYVDEAKAKDMRQAALNSWTGKVFCVGYAIVKDNKIEGHVNAFCDDDETVVLKDLGDLIIDLEMDQRLNLWGWNSIDFDFPYLYDRYRALDIGIPAILSQRYHLKDVKTLGRIGKSTRLAKHRLDDQLWANGMESKSGHGSDVANWYQEGEFRRIEEYCKDDVRLTAELLIKSRPYRGVNIYSS
jgi:predicted PolB exonuclease-like 3'-5' exonuclease